MRPACLLNRKVCWVGQPPQRPGFFLCSTSGRLHSGIRSCKRLCKRSKMVKTHHICSSFCGKGRTVETKRVFQRRNGIDKLRFLRSDLQPWAYTSFSFLVMTRPGLFYCLREWSSAVYVFSYRGGWNRSPGCGVDLKRRKRQIATESIKSRTSHSPIFWSSGVGTDATSYGAVLHPRSLCLH